MPTTKPAPFPARLAALRRRAGLSIPALAARAGLTRQAVYRLENGQRPDPAWSTVQALAAALGVATDALRG